MIVQFNSEHVLSSELLSLTRNRSDSTQDQYNIMPERRTRIKLSMNAIIVVTALLCVLNDRRHMYLRTCRIIKSVNDYSSRFELHNVHN